MISVEKLISLTSLAFVIYLIPNFFSSFDSDGYFLIASGREIINNGFSYNHPFSIAHDMYYVVQQWLYTIFLAYLDSIGIGAVLFGTFGITCLLIFISSLFLKERNENITKNIAVCLSLFFVCCNLPYMVNVRPEAISVILIILQFICLERYKKSFNLKSLFLLPFLFLLEANIHMSMIFIHVAFFIPYFLYLPSKILNWFNLKDNHIQLNKKLILLLFISLCVSLINPYGFEGINYLYNSLTANTFKYISILEVAKLELASLHGACFSLMIALLWFLAKKKKVGSDTFLFVLGINLMYALAIRNSMFIIISMLFLASELNYNLKIKECSKRLLLYPSIIILVGIYNFVGMNISFDSYNSVINEKEDLPINCVEYLNKNEPKDVKIFTGFSWGGYLEYLGYKNIFIDARPELYMAKLNKTENSPLIEYSQIAINGNIKSLSPKEMSQTTEKFLNKYDFKYILLNKKLEHGLSVYLGNNSNWKIVASDNNVFLFRKDD